MQKKTTTVFTEIGDIIKSSSVDLNNMPHTLKPGQYEIQYSEREGYYLVRRDQKPTPNKVYGNVKMRTRRILDTYRDRVGRNTGVLLSGLRGTGKTILARDVAETFIQEGGIVLVVTAGFSGSQFNQFITSFKQPAMILVDEFEKVYNDEECQQNLLTLMDGLESDHKLWMLTVNETTIDQCMFNRPSRIFYHFTYTALGLDVVREICEDHRLDEIKTNQLLSKYRVFLEPTYDVILSVIEECKRYDLMPLEVLADMNVKSIDPTDALEFCDIQICVDGKTVASFQTDYFSPKRARTIDMDREIMIENYDLFKQLAERNVRFNRYISSMDEELLEDNEKFFDEHFYTFCRMDLKYQGITELGEFLIKVSNFNGVTLKVEEIKTENNINFF